MERDIVIDTSILISLQRGEQKSIARFKKHIDTVRISRITACEFIYGSRDAQEKHINKDFLEHFPIIEIDKDISQMAYNIIDRYGLKSRIGISDAYIAATALVHDYRLWTLNMKHFREISEIILL